MCAWYGQNLMPLSMNVSECVVGPVILEVYVREGHWEGEPGASPIARPLPVSDL